jgi:hypothetical protein
MQVTTPTQTLRGLLEQRFPFLSSCEETDGELSESTRHKDIKFDKREENPLNEDQVFEVVEEYCSSRGFGRGKNRGNGVCYMYKETDDSLLHICISVDHKLVQVSVFPD